MRRVGELRGWWCKGALVLCRFHRLVIGAALFYLRRLYLSRQQ